MLRIVNCCLIGRCKSITIFLTYGYYMSLFTILIYLLLKLKIVIVKKWMFCIFHWCPMLSILTSSLLEIQSTLCEVFRNYTDEWFTGTYRHVLLCMWFIVSYSPIFFFKPSYWWYCLFDFFFVIAVIIKSFCYRLLS